MQPETAKRQPNRFLAAKPWFTCLLTFEIATYSECKNLNCSILICDPLLELFDDILCLPAIITLKFITSTLGKRGETIINCWRVPNTAITSLMVGRNKYLHKYQQVLHNTRQQ
jgi:hypothetical protein